MKPVKLKLHPQWRLIFFAALVLLLVISGLTNMPYVAIACFVALGVLAIESAIGLQFYALKRFVWWWRQE